MFGLKTRRFDGGPIAHPQQIGGGCGGPTRTRPVGLTCGLVAGTCVATALGWRPVEAITDGDLVLTFDRGLQPVRGVVRGLHWDKGAACPPALQPLSVPAGALGNQDDMTLLPEQPVLVESDTTDILFGDPFMLMSGADLDGFRGIERVMPDIGLEVIQLQFDTDEVVFANRGALAFCPAARMLGVDAAAASAGYHSLQSDKAAILLNCLKAEDAVAARCHEARENTYAAAFA